MQALRDILMGAVEHDRNFLQRESRIVEVEIPDSGVLPGQYPVEKWRARDKRQQCAEVGAVLSRNVETLAASLGGPGGFIEWDFPGLPNLFFQLRQRKIFQHTEHNPPARRVSHRDRRESRRGQRHGAVIWEVEVDAFPALE